MSKLTTKELKKMISGWLDNPSYRKFLEDYTELRGQHYLSPEDEIEYIRKMFGLQKTLTLSNYLKSIFGICGRMETNILVRKNIN